MKGAMLTRPSHAVFSTREKPMMCNATSRRSSVRAAIAAAAVAVVLTGCGSALVAVRNDGDAYNLDVAQRTADRECAARGAGAAQYVMTQHNPQAAGSQWSMPRRDPPEILYRCTPAAARTS
jgi:hypothetical protein